MSNQGNTLVELVQTPLLNQPFGVQVYLSLTDDLMHRARQAGLNEAKPWSIQRSTFSSGTTMQKRSPQGSIL
jgi:hypothetical protein